MWRNIMGKGGRPRKAEVAIWEEKYYKLSDMRDNKAIRKTVEDRIYKGFASLFTWHMRENLIKRMLELSINRWLV